MEKKEPVIFAVYGTLKRGFGNNRLLRDATFLGTHTTEPKYTMHSAGGFPIVVTGGKTPIKCELFATEDPAVIERVDLLEGFNGKGRNDNWYDRETIETPMGKAEMYVMHTTRHGAIIEDGEWKR